MNLKIENWVLFLMVVTDFGRTVLSFDPKCPPLKLVNGRSRYQWRGRSVRFNCRRSFQLVGVKYATCMNGKWDADVPICVKYGCRVPSTTHVNGQFIESYRGAVVKIVCNPGYSLIGSPSVYCNGIRWNESFPVCRVTNSNPALSCNFEDENLCGWSQDPMHDFDTKRRNSSALLDGSGIGPTLNDSRGFYMYFENSGSMTENYTARLFSPVYPPEYSNGTCFRFWYHMWGSTTGFLKVYVKPEGVELWNLIPSFWMNGDQGESWIQSFIPVEPMETPFQIVIEGVRGPGAVGELAFDDVSLTSAEECSALEAMTSSTSSTDFTYSVSPFDDMPERFSCANRCGPDYSPDKTNMTAPSDECSCSETCDSVGTCCSDYFEYCSPSPSTSTPTSTATTTQIDTVSESASSPSSLPSVVPEKLPSPNPSPKYFNNESNEIDPGKPLKQIPPLTTPNRVSNELHRQIHSPDSRTTPKSALLRPQPEATTAKNDDSKTVINAMKTANRMVPKVVPPKPSTGKVKSQKVPANGAAVNATSSQIPRGDVRPGPGRKAKPEPVLKSGSVTSQSTATTPARVFKNSNPNNIKLTYLEKPSRPNLSNDSRFTKGNPKEVSGKEPPLAIKIDKSEESGGVPIREIVEFGGTALSVLVVAVVGFFWYKRRAIRKSERDNKVEDSDSIVYKMEASTLGTSEYHSLVCIRPGGLGQSP